MSETPLAFTVDGQTLRATLHLPDGEKPAPAVLWLHGYTGNRIEAHRLFVDGARRLQRAGVASLRVDFRGSGESDGEFKDQTFQSLIADAKAAIQQLRQHPAIDPDRLIVLGYSFGGAVAAQLAAEPGLAGMVVWSPVVFPVPIFARMGLYAAHPELSRQGWIDKSGYQVGRGFLAELASVDPLSALADFNQPFYVLYGGEDTVATSENAEALLQELPGATGESLPHGDHLFATVEAREWLLGKTEQWILGQVAGVAIS